MKLAHPTLSLTFVMLPFFAHASDLLQPHERSAQVGIQQQVQPQPNEFWLAIVGDSSTTGVATHPALSATWTSLAAQVFGFLLEPKRAQLTPRIEDYPSPERFGIQSPIVGMTRVLYSQQEFQAAQAAQINAEGKASIRLDTPEYSFGYMVGRALGIDPEHIVLTGQDGKRINTMARQFTRILEVQTPTLPPLVLVSYVANDFCHPNNFTRPVSEFRQEYGGDLQGQLEAIMQMRPHANGTEIVILAPLDVVQLLTNESLLQQRVPFEGRGEISCGDLRRGAIGEGDGRLAMEMAKTLAGECRGVLSPSTSPEVHLQRLRDLQNTQVQVLEEAIARFNRTAPTGMQARLAQSTRQIEFQKGDLAGDCFHPGIRGHARIADQLLKNELAHLSQK